MKVARNNWSRARNSLFNSRAPWNKKLLILCYFKTFIYGRTCTARVQGHVQRCSSTKFNSCTEIITVLSKVRFVGNTVIMVTLTTTTTKWGLSSAEVGEVGLPAAHLTAHVGQQDVIIPFGHLWAQTAELLQAALLPCRQNKTHQWTLSVEVLEFKPLQTH